MFKENTVFIIDGSAQIFRAFYAIDPRLSNGQGLPTNAIYGFTSIIVNLMKEHNPEHLLVVFDDSGSSFRNEIYPEYKANRGEAPEDLIPQFPYFEQVCDALGVATAKIPHYEADDVIGTLAVEYASNGKNVVIVSGDKDFGQLVNQKIHMFDPMKKKVFNEEAIFEKFGIYPEKMRDYLALMGDASDNVPGVRGVGPKTAVKLLNEFGDIEKIIESTDSLKGSLKKKVEENIDMLKLSQRLVTIVTDIAQSDLDRSIEHLKYSGVNLEVLNPLFSFLNFKTMLKNLGGKFVDENSDSESIDIDSSKYKLINDESEWLEVKEKLLKTKTIAIDTETDSIDFHTAKLVGVSLSDGENTVYVPLAHKDETVKQFETAYFIKELSDLLKGKVLLGHNIKYDLHVLTRHGFNFTHKIEDTMLMSYLLNPDSSSHSLDHLAFDLLGHENISFSEVTGGKSFDQVEIEKAFKYAAEDALVTALIYQKLSAKMPESLINVYELECKIVVSLLDMEKEGILINRELLSQLADEYELEIKKSKEEIFSIAGEEFNVNSPKQLQKILYDKLGLPVIKKTKTGPSTNQEVLNKLARRSDICKMILNYRSFSKLNSTYVQPFLSITEEKPRIHTSFHQMVTGTGRLSSSSPNLQNIPVKGQTGSQIRSAFIAREGYQFVGLDYSQVELRILAALCKDENFIKAFKEEKDIHSYTASLIFGIDEENVDSDNRRIAKTINFGIIYGMSAFRLSDELEIPRKEAEFFINQFFSSYPGIKPWFDETIANAEESGYVETILGRRRVIPNLKAKNFNLREAAKRMAMNAPIQGSAADLIKLAMTKFTGQTILEEYKARLLLQVHDELLFEVKEEMAHDFSAEAKSIMENVYELGLPLSVSTMTGKNWEEVH